MSTHPSSVGTDPTGWDLDAMHRAGPSSLSVRAGARERHTPSMDTEPITEHFDRSACCRGAMEPDGDLIPMTARLAAELEHTGLEGQSVLEVGCGRGGLLVTLLRRGAAQATGIDLSPAAVAAAERLADAVGVGDRCEVGVGNGAEGGLPEHDVVVLDRVICCYPDATGLLASTVPAARSTYAFVVPASRGLRGLAARVALGAENTLRVVRRDPFRAFVHDVDGLDRTLSAEGFALRARSLRLLWELRIYTRTS